MHGGDLHQGQRLIWLVSGTGDGPPLARALLAAGWRVRVSVVTATAGLAYYPSPALELKVGPLGDAASVATALAEADSLGERPDWVVDATHPFAARISAALAAACSQRGQPLLRLERPSVPLGHARLLPGLGDLHGLDLGGRRLLLAIGARQLQRAVSLTPAALHHARILPSAEALAEAMAAGLAPERVACLRPTAQGMVERALCRHWRIELVLCRRSGGPGEALWHTITAAEGIGLLLLERPAEPSGIACLGRTALLERIGTPK